MFIPYSQIKTKLSFVLEKIDFRRSIGFTLPFLLRSICYSTMFHLKNKSNFSLSKYRILSLYLFHCIEFYLRIFIVILHFQKNIFQIFQMDSY